MTEKKREIKTVQDIIDAGHEIIGHLVQGKMTYFNLLVEEEAGSSACFFTPASQLQDTGKHMIMVEDYEKILMVLLSHPDIESLEYDPERNMVTAIFKNPYAKEYRQLSSGEELELA